MEQENESRGLIKYLVFVVFVCLLACLLTCLLGFLGVEWALFILSLCGRTGKKRIKSLF